MKVASFNVNGIRAITKKPDFSKYLYSADAPDIIGFQETKISPDQLTKEFKEPSDYYAYYNCANQKGYSGTAIWSKLKPLNVIIDYPHPTFNHTFHNTEGRVLGLEFDTFYFFTVYFPNGGKSPEHFEYKFEFYKSLFEYFETLKKTGKDVIISGDFNVAHTELDIARPKENELSIGFTKAERKLLDKVEADGYIDSFRKYCKEGGHYSWWHYFTNSRARNIGWRIDYIFVTEGLGARLSGARILDHVLGSDHCPVEIEFTCSEDSRRGEMVMHEGEKVVTLF